MNAEDFRRWMQENGGTGTTDYYANRISYKFVTLPDGWTAIFEVDRGQYIPLIQAADRAHAESYCYLREPVTVPLQRI